MEGHELKIISLHDAQAQCACGRWYFCKTGAAARKEIKESWSMHLRNLRSCPNGKSRIAVNSYVADIVAKRERAKKDNG
ncbi:MAG: hypothetical protein EHM36_06620 [Deltaproteobacteria bacterium]|nr:MAG: hypothetical protein EHM36_06620 [Deltaproteobacteria bacterium]